MDWLKVHACRWKCRDVLGAEGFIRLLEVNLTGGDAAEVHGDVSDDS